MNRCHFEDRIDAYLLDKLDETGRAEFEEHYFNCPSCFREMELRDRVIRVVKTRDVFPRRAEARLKPWPGMLRFLDSPVRRWAAAGTAAVALLAIAFIVAPRGGPAPGSIALTDSETLRGGTVRAIEPRGTLAAAPVSLAWESLGKGVDYQVTVYDGASVVWTMAAPSSPAEIPAEVRARLLPGRDYAWQVKAFSSVGTLLAASGKISFSF